VTPPIPKQSADVANERKRNEHGERRKGRTKIGRRGAMTQKMKRGRRIGEAEKEREVGVRVKGVQVGVGPQKNHRVQKKRKTIGLRNLLGQHRSYPSILQAEAERQNKSLVLPTLGILMTTT
jgi:hypothetical protein